MRSDNTYTSSIMVPETLDKTINFAKMKSMMYISVTDNRFKPKNIEIEDLRKKV